MELEVWTYLSKSFHSLEYCVLILRHVHGYPTHEEVEKIKEVISGLPLAQDMTNTVIMHSFIPSLS